MGEPLLATAPTTVMTSAKVLTPTKAPPSLSRQPNTAQSLSTTTTTTTVPTGCSLTMMTVNLAALCTTVTLAQTLDTTTTTTTTDSTWVTAILSRVTTMLTAGMKAPQQLTLPSPSGLLSAMMAALWMFATMHSKIKLLTTVMMTAVTPTTAPTPVLTLLVEA